MHRSMWSMSGTWEHVRRMCTLIHPQHARYLNAGCQELILLYISNHHFRVCGRPTSALVKMWAPRCGGCCITNPEC
jgi:hypothetical protein